MIKNETKFVYTDVKDSNTTLQKNYDFNKLYEACQKELTLQQNKRDQIISFYLALITFSVPFTLGEKITNDLIKGIIFTILGIIGIFLALAINRYRVYKEVYWMSCQTISQLKNYEPESIKKSTVQSIFYSVLSKKGKKYFVGEDKNKLSYGKVIKQNLWSAETLHSLVHYLVTSSIVSTGMSLIIYSFFKAEYLFLAIIWIVVAFIVCFILLCRSYFIRLKQIYNVLEDGLDSSFNSTFEKAWFLHFYLSDEEEARYEKQKQNN